MAKHVQLRFDWNQAKSEPSSPLHSETMPKLADASLETTSVEPQSKWDFLNTFPNPRGDAVQAGLFGMDELTGDQIRGIHIERAAECFSLLVELTRINEARLTRVDPRTGSKPRTANTRKRLDEFLNSEPRRLTRDFNHLMAVYEDGFGEDAAKAFRMHLLSAHPKAYLEQVGDPEYEEPIATVITPPPDPGMGAETDLEHRADNQTSSSENPLPTPRPLPEAMGRGAFGRDEDGVVDPSEEEVEEITQRHGEKLIEVLERLQQTDDRLLRMNGGDAHLLCEREGIHSEYMAALSAYGEDFGSDSRMRLDAWAQSELRLQADEGGSYEPGHPWYYYSEGDGQSPVPVDQIPANPGAGEHMTLKLPRNRTKRSALIRKVLGEQTEQLQEDKRRYQELVERGPAALSDYDRNIAHCGNAELAWASAIALKYNHIRNGIERVRRLRSLNSGF